jgi:methyl-accepting chemotaxis protein
MQFKSIQTSVVVLAGAALLTVVIALAVHSGLSGIQTQSLIQERSQQLLGEVIEDRLVSLVQAQANNIQNELQDPMLLASNLAQLHGLLGSLGADGKTPLGIGREEIIQLLKSTLASNPKLYDLYTVWEPNAFGNNDALYAGQPGHDANGRFTAWLYRSGTDLQLAEITDSESEKILPTGLREGEYYLWPREHKRKSVVGPSVYEIDGKMTMIASFNAPVLVDGQFKGLVGIELALAFIQDLLVAAGDSLYEGAGELALISANSRLVASTQAPDKLGEPASTIIDAKHLELIASLPSNRVTYEMDEATESIDLFFPFNVAGSETVWTLFLQLPESAVFGQLQALQEELAERRHSEVTIMVLVGLLFAVFGLVMLWLVGRGIARPLQQMVGALTDLAKGEGDLTVRLHTDRGAHQ